MPIKSFRFSDIKIIDDGKAVRLSTWLQEINFLKNKHHDKRF
jgi:hypothetical protein